MKPYPIFLTNVQRYIRTKLEFFYSSIGLPPTADRLLATRSDDRVVSLLGKWRFIDSSLMWPPRDMTGWEPLNPLWLSCLTGRGGVHTESYSTILSAFRRSRTMTQTRSRRYRNSLSTFTEGQNLSVNTLICAHSTSRAADFFDPQRCIQAHWLAGSLHRVWDRGRH